MLEAELAAGSVDVGAFAFADGGGDTGGFEDAHEFAFVILGGFGEGGFGDAVHGDQVDVGAASGEEAGKLAGVLRGIVLATDEDVFVGHSSAADVEVIVGRLEDFLDTDVLVDGDQFGAESVVGSVEGDGEVIGFPDAGQFADFFGKSDGGDGDSAQAHPESSLFTDVVECSQEIGEVGKRLADAHDDDIGDSFISGEEPIESENLFENFSGGEAAFNAEQSTRTENAAHGAADLGADADGATIFLAHQNAFKGFAVSGLEEEFFGTVAGGSMIDNLGGEEVEGVVEPSPQIGGEIGHDVEVIDSFSEDPFANLIGAKGRVAFRLAPRLQFRTGEVSKSSP